MSRHLRPRDRPDIFEPVLALPTFLVRIRLKVLDGITGERYASRMRDVHAGRRD
jgi:hypothetical protein